MKCSYAWTHLDFKKGGYAPCFRFKNTNDVQRGEYWLESGADKLPSQVINNKDFQTVREQLRNDEWPAGCIDCKTQEDAGMSSYRTRSLEYSDQYTEPDYDSNVAVIRDLQLKMSRACNYTCRHCDSASNSSFEKLGRQFPEIENELKTKYQFSHITPAGDKKIIIPTAEVMEDLYENVFPTVEQLEFSGGEPFYQIEMYKVLQRLIDHPNIDTTKMRLVYNSNMSQLTHKGYSVKELFPHFKEVHITVSMDGTGKLFEYFREGGNWDNVISNIKEIAPYVHQFLFVCTTSSYQAFYMNEIYADLMELKASIPETIVQIRATFVHWPKAMDIVNLEEETKSKIMQTLEINEFTKEFAIRLTSTDNEIEPCFKGLVKTQDLLYDRSCEDMAPKIYEYICS